MGNHLEVQLVNPDIISIPSLGNRRENPPPIKKNLKFGEELPPKSQNLRYV